MGTITLETNIPLQAELHDSMESPSPAVLDLLKRIQGNIELQNPSGSMDGPSEAVKSKLKELGIY